jgi:hypothetical protein
MKQQQYKLRMVCLILCVALSGLNSCKKSAPSNNGTFDNDPILTQTIKYLTQSPWKTTTVEYEYPDGSWLSVPLQSATQAETLTFTSTGMYNGTYAVTAPGATPVTGTWIIIGDRTQLALDMTTTYDFSILNNTTMQLTLQGQISYTDPATNITSTYSGFRQTYGH